jgi:hypothetical protein
MTRFAAILTKISAIIFGLSLILWPISYCFNGTDSLPFPPSVPLPGGFRCSVYHGGIWLFNTVIAVPADWKGDSHMWTFKSRARKGRTPVIIQDWQWELGGAKLSQWTYRCEGDGEQEFLMIARDGDAPGILYRSLQYFYQNRQYGNHSALSLRVSFLYPVLIFGFISAMRLLHARYGRTKR